jgi:hypothetical protein
LLRTRQIVQDSAIHSILPPGRAAPPPTAPFAFEDV